MPHSASKKLGSDEIYSNYLDWYLKRLGDKHNQTTDKSSFPKPNSKTSLNSPKVNKITSAKAIEMVELSLKEGSGLLDYGDVKNLTKHKELWLIEFPNLLRGGSLTFLNPENGEVLVRINIIEG